MAAASGDNLELIVSSVQVASDKWVAFDWNGKLAQCDSNLGQTKDAREQQKAARKQLSDATKRFKRDVKNLEQASQSLSSSPLSGESSVSSMVKAVDSLAKECRTTVKAYQEEIDNLTRRCKSSENNYSALCQSLAELPDPSAVIVTALQQMHMNKELVAQVQNYQKEIAQLKESSKNKTDSSSNKQEREELVQLRREVSEYEVEFRSLKNQDITIRKLEAKIVEMQKAGEEELQEKVEKAQQELAETEGRRAAEALEREAAAERKVQTLELELKAERAGREAAQSHLLDADEGAGEREAAWEAQRRILVDDAERLRESLHQATRERDELRLRVAATEGDSGSSSNAPRSGGISMADFMTERKAYEAEVSDLSHTANILREELRLKEEATTEERRSLQAKIESLEREKAAVSSSIVSLEAQLASVPSQSLIDNMKRELRILKRLEYNADDIDADRDPEMTGGLEDEEKELESVLVAKLRRAESELVKERNAKIDYAKQCEQLRKDVEGAVKAKEEADRLIESLEKDLERAIVATPSPSKKLDSSDTLVAKENPAALQNILDPNSPPPPPTPDSSSTDKKNKTSSEKAEDDHSVATIVMAQRDRLRARCEALEAERDSFKRELQVQVQASESLKTDNTKLYEKVRYLQNYNAAPSSGRTQIRRLYSGGERDLDLEALEQRYEASVDPFRQFSRAERQRKMNEMSPVERMVFIVSKTVLGTKEMRTALFIYVVAMHSLVFLTTYHWSHSGGCDSLHRDAEDLTHLPPIIAAAAKEVAAAEGGGA